jgi:Ni/Co efflux regulator RcnB
MKRTFAAAIALSLIAGSATSAYADGRDHDRDDHGHERHEYRDHRDERPNYRHEERRDNHEHWRDRFNAREYYRPHEYRSYAWRGEERFPPAYYAPRYVVENYGAYRLRPPPRGCHWVRVDNDVLLTAIATGAVIEVVSNLF